MSECPMPEIWLPVVGFEGFYEVSDLGRFGSVDRYVDGSYGARRFIKGFVKDLKPGFGGYVMTSLYKDNVQTQVRVHTLVLEAFVGPAPEGMECLHRDGNPANNALSNLEWGTSSSNKYDIVSHGHHHATLKETCPRGHPLEFPNLTPLSAAKGQRACLACKRARDNASYYWKQGRPYDFERAADRHYEAIMREAGVTHAAWIPQPRAPMDQQARPTRSNCRKRPA